MPSAPLTPDALVIGGGPAGLMAAEMLLAAGRSVLLADQRPSLARKLLMAGKSGLNLTKDEDVETCLQAYGGAAGRLGPMIRAFPPEAVRSWAEGLGQPLFTGSSGRVFPEAMKASPLVRAWLGRLGAAGLAVRTRWRWTGWTDDAATFETPEGPVRVAARTTILALGGASWARLGSDWRWTGALAEIGAPLVPFAPANAGLKIPWSDHMAPHLGRPLKNVVFRSGGIESRGEAVLSAGGLEGGGLYPLSPALRTGAPLAIDLCPDVAADTLAARLAARPSRESASNRVRKAARLGPVARALVAEVARPCPRSRARWRRCSRRCRSPMTASDRSTRRSRPRGALPSRGSTKT
ncbi:TIGR03862 family flavoprotein [Roseivivax isoporae]|uniref:TIGR03862 family flavoprotein n=1 Tax=Roseivivax isoporae TaxID=591206 RepID=UPI0004BBCA58